MVPNTDIPQRFFVFTTPSGIRFGVGYPHTEVTGRIVHHEFVLTRIKLEHLDIETVSDPMHDELLFEVAPSVRFVAATPADAAMLLRDLR